tara:strand:+ start:4023 stop:4718 length:696 start_codon:yes stop_codon:yes gene_type:complete
MSFERNENICIFGMRGAGKSTLCRKIQNFYPNIFIFDTLGEYTENDGIIFYDYISFSDYVIKSQNINGIRAIVQFDIEDSNNQEIFDEYIKLLYYRGECTIVIEEVQNFASVYKIPPFLKQASLTGRHRGINFITTTQRIAEIHKSLLSQCHHLFSGYTDSPNDKRTLKEYGFNIGEIENLNQFIFLWKQGRDILIVDNSLNFKEKGHFEENTAEIQENVDETEEIDLETE